MTFQEFDTFELALLVEVNDMNFTKGREYTDGVDRFQNFNEEAKEMDVDRLKVAEIFLNKHMRAIKSYIRTGKIHSTESIRGRFVDAIKYLTLIAGMVEEDKKWELSKKDVEKMGTIEDQNSGKHQPFEFNPSISHIIHTTDCNISYGFKCNCGAIKY